MAHKKKSKEGQAERYNLIVEYFGAEAVKETRTKYLTKHVGDDDIYDAFAALWTAERIYNENARVIPDPSPLDMMGLRMEMWY